jgi:molecular chaperone GrpE
MIHTSKTDGAPKSNGGQAPETEQEEMGQKQTASEAREDSESLRGKLADAVQQRDQYLAMLRQAQSDFENYRKRTQRDLAEERRYAQAPLIRELLPVLDNLRRALAVTQHQADPLVEGVSLVESQLRAALSRFGVKPIDAMNKSFDPNWHEAVQQRPQSGVAPETVLEVLEPGYTMHERVLRPAKVVVAANQP